VLTRIADHPARQIADLLPWHWKPAALDRAAAWPGVFTERLRETNSVSLSNSSRKRPLKLSMKAFCVGLPGAM
jgi:hypothetical protein